MFNAKAYSASSATSPLAPTEIARRDLTENDVQIEILFCGICHSDLHYIRNEWSDVMPTVQDLKQHAGGEDSFVELVRGAIQQKLTGHRPTTQDVARDLHISSRTLQRRLQESGSSFQRVLDEARRQMARYYLSDSVLELNEAAYLLGYEDANSFARAFRGWEGMPPRDWRETRRATAVN